MSEVEQIKEAVERQSAYFPPEPLSGNLDEAVTAADHALARIGSENAGLLVAALSAGWMTPAEYETLKPLAVAVAYIGGVAYPEHRGGGVVSEPTYPPDWHSIADRKASELIGSVDVVTVTNGDYEKLVQLVGTAYLLGRRDEVRAALNEYRGDEA